MCLGCNIGVGVVRDYRIIVITVISYCHCRVSYNYILLCSMHVDVGNNYAVLTNSNPWFTVIPAC